jgi:hypothetical protein
MATGFILDGFGDIVMTVSVVTGFGDIVATMSDCAHTTRNTPSRAMITIP